MADKYTGAFSNLAPTTGEGEEETTTPSAPEAPAPLSGKSYLPLIKTMEASGDEAISPSGAVGRYQIMPNTARQYGFDPTKLKDPEYNEQAATVILDDLHTRFKGDPEAVMIGYNAGPTVARRWLESGKTAGIPEETSKYLERGRKFLSGNPLAAAAGSGEVQVAQADTAPGGDKYSGLFSGLAPTADGEAETPQDRSAARLPKMAGHALASGAQNLLGLPGTLNNFVADKLPSWATNELYIGTQPDGKFGIGTRKDVSSVTGESIGKLTGLGLEQHKELTPETALERYGSAIVSAVPAIPLALGAGLGLASAAAITESGAVAAEAAHDIAPENKWLPIVAGVIGSLAAGGLVGVVKKGLEATAAFARLGKAEQELDKALDASFALRDPAGKVASKTTRAANDLEVAQDRAAEGRETAAKSAARVQKASDASLAATEKATADMTAAVEADSAKTVETTAAALGPSTTLQKAGATLQTAARDWKEKVFPKKIAEVAKPLDEAVPGETQTPLFSFSKALSDIVGTGGKLAALRAELTPKLPARLKAVLDDTLDSPAGVNAKAAEPGTVPASGVLTSEGKAIIEAPGKTVAASPVTWAEVRDLRSALGDALGNPKIVNEIGEQNLRHLYATVTADLRSAAKDRGPEALKLFDRYNEVTTELYNTAGGPMSRIINSTNKALESIKPENVAKDLLDDAKVGATDLARLRLEIPAAVDDLAAVGLRKSDYASLSEEGKTTLFGKHVEKLEEAARNRAQAGENAKTVLGRARQEAADLRAAADEAALTGKFDRLRVVREAQKAKRAEDRANSARSRAAAQTEAGRNYAGAKRVREARKEVKQAKAGVPAPVNPLTEAAHALNRVASGGAAYAMAEPVLNALALPVGPGTKAAIGAAGLAVPWLLRQGRETLRNPSKLAIPITGGVVGGNALTPTKSK